MDVVATSFSWSDGLLCVISMRHVAVVILLPTRRTSQLRRWVRCHNLGHIVQSTLFHNVCSVIILLSITALGGPGKHTKVIHHKLCTIDIVHLLTHQLVSPVLPRTLILDHNALIGNPLFVVGHLARINHCRIRIVASAVLVVLGALISD